MRIARRAVALALAAAAALAGCTSEVPGTATAERTGGPAPSSAPSEAPTAPPEGLFVDAQGRFGLVPPDGWEVDASGQQGTAVVFRSTSVDTSPTDPGPFVANINVLVAPSAGATLAQTVVGARQELQAFEAYASTADEPVTLSDGTEAHVLGGTFTDSGFALQNLQLFTVAEGNTVVVTGTSLAATWPTNEAVLDGSLRTLTVNP